ncbi:MAG: tRNA 2-thiouridine(34) synthase MnmA [Bacillota bacterium]
MKTALYRVAVALSGGVDSAAAAVIIREQGHRVFGVTMRLTDAPVTPAAEVASALGIEHHIFDLREMFRDVVIDAFVAEYLAGRTPNPCVVCNPRIKFGALLQKALELGAERFATGHYARVFYDSDSGRFLLARSLNPRKDQSYALYALKQEQLSRLQLPLGTKTKEEAREIVRRRGVEIAGKESQEICFIPVGDYRTFLRDKAGGGIKPGRIIDHKGNVLGRHNGLPYYTVGQRRGLGLAAGYPLFVTALDTARNELVVGPVDMLYSDGCMVGGMNFIPFDRLEKTITVSVKVRYAAKAKPAEISPAGNDRVAVRFKTPERAVAPGQAAVFYDGDVVVGGGTILYKDEG